MTLSQACEKIRAAFAQMNASYGRAVFDEWAVLETDGPRYTLLAYEGPRRGAFTDHVRRDLWQLQVESEKEPGEPGCFGFAREAEGRAIDAYIVIGPDLYLLCNNTTSTVQAITQDPHWKKAQIPFAELAEAFRQRPVRQTTPAA